MNVRRIAGRYAGPGRPGFAEYALHGTVSNPESFLLEIESHLHTVLEAKDHVAYHQLTQLRNVITEDVFWGSEC